jgi:hypothetical protein
VSWIVDKARLEWQLAGADVGFLQVLGVGVHREEQTSVEELAGAFLELRGAFLALLLRFTLLASERRLLDALRPAGRRSLEGGVRAVAKEALKHLPVLALTEVERQAVANELRSSTEHFLALRSEGLLVGFRRHVAGHDESESTAFLLAKDAAVERFVSGVDLGELDRVGAQLAMRLLDRTAGGGDCFLSDGKGSTNLTRGAVEIVQQETVVVSERARNLASQQRDRHRIDIRVGCVGADEMGGHHTFLGAKPLDDRFERPFVKGADRAGEGLFKPLGDRGAVGMEFRLMGGNNHRDEGREATVP